MKREKLLSHLRLHHCILFREGGKHSVFLNPTTGKITSVPQHPDIKRFAVINICKDLEIPVPSGNLLLLSTYPSCSGNEVTELIILC